MLVKDQGYQFFAIKTGKLRRYFSWQNFLDFFRIIIGIKQAYSILKKEKPNLIFAKGGYVSVPVAVAGYFLKIPVIIHESDSIPGLATKIMAKFAKKICLSFESSKQYFKNKNIVITGNPIRKEILEGNYKQGCAITGFKGEKPIIFITGGSTGALFINKLIQTSIPKLVNTSQIVHQCGAGKEIEIDTEKNKDDYRQYDYLADEFKHIYAISDFLIARAGANNLSELAALGKPVIAIPLPSSASQHQLLNARAYAEKNACILVEEKDLTPQKFVEIVSDLLNDQNKMKELSRNIRKIAVLDGADKVSSVILDTVDSQ